jgi:hypothetical protein
MTGIIIKPSVLSLSLSHVKIHHVVVGQYTTKHTIWSEDICRIMTALMVETVIIACITASPIWQAVILVIMHAETFKNDLIVFIGIKRHNARHIDSSYIFQYQSQYIDTDVAFTRNYQFKKTRLPCLLCCWMCIKMIITCERD